MKMEAYWILTNLAMGTVDEVSLILGLPSNLEIEYSSSLSIMELVDQDLQQLLQENIQDMQKFNSISWFIDNAVQTDTEICE